MTAETSPAPAPTPTPTARASRILFVVGIALLVVDVLTVTGLWIHRRHAADRARHERTESQAKGIRVRVTKVTLSPAERSITLPADVHGFREATLYAKVSGYVKAMHAERGQRVAAGDLLATLVSPETEQDVASARSEYALRQRNAARARSLVKPGVVAEQDLESAVADEKVARANLARAQSLLGYTELRAPFAGTVTARYADEGALLPAATGATQAATPLVAVADTDQLRVYVYAGQDVAPFVKAGDPVVLSQDDARRDIAAQVTRTAGALDPRTRTMQVEIVIDNRPWGILPGTFAHAKLTVHVEPAPMVPNEALVLRDAHTQVAVIEGDHARLVDVELGASDGRTTLVRRGLSGGETVGLGVPVEVESGSVVQPVAK